MNLRRFFAIFILVAALPVLAGAGLAAWTAWWAAGQQHLTGTVAGFRAAPVATTRDRVATFWIVVDLTLPDGQVLQARSTVSSNVWGYAAGDPIKVIWSPDTPDLVRVDSLVWLYFPAAVTAIPGLVMLAAILLVRRLVRRQLPAGSL